MNCIGCDNSGYRKLCYYDNEHNTCTPNNMGKSSYQCVGMGYGGSGKQCVLTNLPPGDDRYSTMNECQSNCSRNNPPLGQTSYQCVGMGYGGSGKQCVLTNLPPGNGRFTNMNDCQNSCSGTGPPGPPNKQNSFLRRFDGVY